MVNYTTIIVQNQLTMGLSPEKSISCRSHFDSVWNKVCMAPHIAIETIICNNSEPVRIQYALQHWPCLLRGSMLCASVMALCPTHLIHVLVSNALKISLDACAVHHQSFYQCIPIFKLRWPFVSASLPLLRTSNHLKNVACWMNQT